MDITLGSILISIFVSSVLLLYISAVLSHTGVLLKSSMKLLTLSIIIVTIRLLLPVEFQFTKTYSTPILGWVSWLLYNFKFIPGVSMAAILLFVWLAVACWKGIRFLLQQYKLYRQIHIFPEYNFAFKEELFDQLQAKSSLRKKLQIIQYPKAVSPAIMGTIHPIILLPKESKPYTEQELFYIFKHELEHYYHHDNWMKLLVELLNIFYWWNPLVYLLRKQLSQASELSNDIKLSQALNEREKINYLECLLNSFKRQEANKKLLEDPSQTIQYFTHARKSCIQQRFLAVLDYSNTKKSRFYNGSLLACVTFSILLSLFVVIEPYYVSSDNTAGTVLLTKDTTCLLDNQNGSYDVYVNSDYFGTISEISEEFSELNIYQSISEVKDHEKTDQIRLIYRSDGNHIINH